MGFCGSAFLCFAAFTQDVAERWRLANRLLLEQYRLWAAQKAEAGG